jgi:hypothetical protein
LLVAQHFDGWFAEDGEIERGALRRRVGEYDLVRQRGLAASRGARDDIKRKFRETAAQDFIKARDPGRQLIYFHLICCAQAFLSPSRKRDRRSRPPATHPEPGGPLNPRQ